MRVFSKIDQIRGYIQQKRSDDKLIGLVPTMGAIHKGHLSLVEKSRIETDITVCSIFVNPSQFNNPEDLEKYPVQTDADLKLLEDAGCDAVFLPSKDEMYTVSDYLNFNFGSLETRLEGEFRPGHFSGVGLVVSKLFNIIQPDKAYFGQKDLQQLAIIKKLVLDLNFPIQVIGVETKREKSGLAMSSRNLRLTASQLQTASKIHWGLQKLKELVLSGKTINQSVDEMVLYFHSEKDIDLEYLEVVDSQSMVAVNSIEAAPEISVCIAAYVGEVRLIDNIYLKKS